MLRSFIGMAAGLALAALPSITTADDSASGGLAPGLADSMDGYGFTVLKTFDAPQATGFVLEAPNGNTLIGYQPEGTENLVLGTMFDGEGTNLTKGHLYDNVTREMLSQTWQALDDDPSRWIADGEAGAPYVYVFDDPMCGYCHKQYLYTRDLVESGQLQIRHVMVAILGPDSERAAHAIVAAEDPLAEYKKHHENFGNGALETSAEFSAEVVAQIEANTRLFGTTQAVGTPAILYRDGDEHFRLSGGLMTPEELMAAVN